MLFEPIELPCGLTLKNRIVKAAMEENMANIELGNAPSEELIKLYSVWAQGGCGLQISGHVMIDREAMSSEGAVCLTRSDNEEYLNAFRSYIAAGKLNDTKFWLQLNHPGRQMPKNLGQVAKAPSAVDLNLGRLAKGLFDTPKELSEIEILRIIDLWAESAMLAEEMGADGVEIHAAHGYLISQFLSPLSNLRKDRWGGSIENRARLLFEVVNRIRSKVTPAFAVAVKINSADFQRGGFEESDSLWVIRKLSDLKLDLIEISGGSFESPVMSSGVQKSDKTRARESYFLQFAHKAQEVIQTPLLVTGGISTKAVAEEVVSSGNVLAGMATALAIMPDLPNRLRDGEDPQPHYTASTSYILSGSSLALAKTKQSNYNMRSLGAGGCSNPHIWPMQAILYDRWSSFWTLRRWASRTRLD